MLCGFHPFFQEDKEKERENILNAKYDFPSPYWDSISDDAKDLINKLLVLDIDRRLSAENILKHPWLNSQNSREQLPFSADMYNKMTKKFKIVIRIFYLLT
jgi:serine/threonine protein kinase